MACKQFSPAERVVVTGLGAVTPLGGNVARSWERLMRGESGIGPIRSFDAANFSSRVAGEVHEEFCSDDWIQSKDQKKMDRFIVLGVSAARQAMEDAGWEPKDEQDHERAGVLIGSGIGGLPEIERTSLLLSEKGPRRVSPFFIPSALINLVSGHVSIMFGLKGPNHSVVTACSSGTNAISDAARLIRCGEADLMVAGGAEAAVCPVGVAGFSALKALSTKFNDQPEKASRPWDKDRDGFVMSDGAGVLVLESLSHAQARGAKIYGEIVGWGMSADAHHVTLPPEDGNGAYRCMRTALVHAGLRPEDIGYVNAHGTSTPAGDEAELKAVERLFPAGVRMSSTKSSTGHLLGAAGSLEAIFTILAIKEGFLPPTLNLDNPSVETFIDLIPFVGQKQQVKYAMSNSFGFGGTNTTLILGRWDGE